MWVLCKSGLEPDIVKSNITLFHKGFHRLSLTEKKKENERRRSDKRKQNYEEEKSEINKAIEVIRKEGRRERERKNKGRNPPTLKKKNTGSPPTHFRRLNIFLFHGRSDPVS